jgi:hypothetical protein
MCALMSHPAADSDDSIEAQIEALTPEQDLRRRALQNALRHGVTREAQPAATTVYHYTGLRGLIGILSDHAIHASNYAFLNDATESKYAREKALNFVDSLDRSTAVREEFATRLRGRLNQYRSNLYVASFCREPDLLSMWRGYAGAHHSPRFSIGLHIDSGAENDSLNVIHGPWNCGPVAYIEDQQERWFTAGTRTIHESLLSSDLAIAGLLGKRCGLHMLLMMPFLKHQAFSEEKEWRAIQEADDVQDAEIDAARGCLFLNYRPRWKTHPERLPVNQILVGPTPDPKLVLARVHLLLEKLGYADIPLSYSKIPFRDW